MTFLFQQKDQDGTEMGKTINLIKEKAKRILQGNDNKKDKLKWVLRKRQVFRKEAT